MNTIYATVHFRVSLSMWMKHQKKGEKKAHKENTWTFSPHPLMNSILHTHTLLHQVASWLQFTHSSKWVLLSLWCMLHPPTDKQGSPPLLQIHWSCPLCTPHTEAHLWMWVSTPSHRLGLAPASLLQNGSGDLSTLHQDSHMWSHLYQILSRWKYIKQMHLFTCMPV